MIKNLFTGRVLNLNLEKALLPNGKEVELEIIRHPGGACALPLHEDGSVTLIRQYRHAAGGMIWEVPAGRIDEGEGPESCAIRELGEEIGLSAGKVEKIAEFFPTPGFCTERIHVYLATQLTPCDQNPEDDEYIEAVRLPLSKALGMVFTGEINDGKTIVALLFARERRSR